MSSPELTDAQLDRLQAAVTSSSPLEGLVVGGRYLVDRRIGSGGMGEVFLAHDQLLDRRVAIKALLRDENESGGRRMREALALARLEHPGIVPIHDLGELPDGRAFFAMQFVDGSTFDSWIAQPGRSLGDRVAMLAKVASIVDYAHQRGVLHCDLKPTNVKIDELGRAYVLDWGIAEEPAAATRNCESESSAIVAGTKGFMAPEQERGDPVDVTTDVWALGAMLQRVLAVESTPAPPRLRRVVQRAMAEEPTHRHPSALAFARDSIRASAPLVERTKLGIGLVILALTWIGWRSIAPPSAAVDRTPIAEPYLAAILEARGRSNAAFETAIERASEIASREANRALRHFRVGRIFRAAMRYPAALREQEKALALDPGLVEARRERGILRSRRVLDSVQATMRELSRVRLLALTGRTPPSRGLVGALGIRSGGIDRRTSALEDLRDSRDAFTIGLEHWLRGRPEDALRHFESANIRGLDHAPAREWTGRLYAMAADPAAAARVFATGCERDLGYVPFGHGWVRALVSQLASGKTTDTESRLALVFEELDRLAGWTPLRSTTHRLAGDLRLRAASRRLIPVADGFRRALHEFDRAHDLGARDAAVDRGDALLGHALWGAASGIDPEDLLDSAATAYEFAEARGTRGTTFTLRKAAVLRARANWRRRTGKDATALYVEALVEYRNAGREAPAWRPTLRSMVMECRERLQ